MITVCSVYRSGGEYDVRYVRRLAAGVRRHLHMPHQFACLTDRIAEVCGPDGLVHKVSPLRHLDWPGWWAKLEMFRLSGPVLYLDLDTVVTGDITPLAAELVRDPECFIMLRDFYVKRYASGIVGWGGDRLDVYSAFVRGFAHRAEFRQTRNALHMRVGEVDFRGDGDWLRDHLQRLGVKVTCAQDLLDGIASYKADVVRAGGPPDGTRIVCFHGHPRPAEVDPAPRWLAEAWTGAA